jgi:VWFA-related protein
MNVPRFVCASIVWLLSGLLTTFAQTAQPDAGSSHSMRITVVADTKSGQPVTDLDQKDFTVFDNKTARPVTSFKMVSSPDEPVHVILLIDTVNMPFTTVAYARDGIEKFLKTNEGQLASPTTIAVLDDKGVKADSNFSTNGLALSDELDHQQIGLRTITRSSEWGGLERFQICIDSLHRLISSAGQLPGRKIVIWVSPGWPLISGPRIELNAHQQQEIFTDIVSVSTELRENKITLYDTNPIGVTESMQQANYYEAFLKGVSKPSQVQFGNLALQVIAAQSGGLVIEANSDVSGMIQRCLLDAKSWYEIGFDPLPSDKPNEYHHIEVKLDRPGLVVRTRDGFYANPVAGGQ